MKLREKRNQKGPQTISLVARIREQNYKNSSADLNKLKQKKVSIHRKQAMKFNGK